MLASTSPPNWLGTVPVALAPPHWSVEPPSSHKSFGIHARVGGFGDLMWDVLTCVEGEGMCLGQLNPVDPISGLRTRDRAI